MLWGKNSNVFRLITEVTDIFNIVAIELLESKRWCKVDVLTGNLDRLEADAKTLNMHLKTTLMNPSPTVQNTGGSKIFVNYHFYIKEEGCFGTLRTGQ